MRKNNDRQITAKDNLKPGRGYFQIENGVSPAGLMFIHIPNY